jgi:hypothetical protein
MPARATNSGVNRRDARRLMGDAYSMCDPSEAAKGGTFSHLNRSAARLRDF